MRATRTRTALAAGLAAALATAPDGARARGAEALVPDHAKVQLAGQIGFLSPGIGWMPASRKVALDLFAGWVPRAIGGDDLVGVTGKVTWQPWHVRGRGGWTFRPITASLQLTYWLGSSYYVLSPPHHPRHYYDFPTALRAGSGLGTTALWRAKGGRRVGAYAELVTLDVLLVAWLRNRSTLDARDAFSLAIGTVVEF